MLIKASLDDKLTKSFFWRWNVPLISFSGTILYKDSTVTLSMSSLCNDDAVSSNIAANSPMSVLLYENHGEVYQSV